MKATAWLMAMGLALAAVAPGAAQAQRKPKAQAETGAPKLKLSKAAQPLLIEVQKLSAAGDNAGALAKLREIEALTGRTPDDDDLVAQFKIQIGQAAKDDGLLREGVEARLASGRLSAEDQPRYVRQLAALAARANDWGGAQAQYERLVQMTPNDPVVQADLARIYVRNKQPALAIAAFERAIAATEAAGQKPEETLYASRLQLAFDAKLDAQIDPAARALVRAYPTPKNWNVAIFALRRAARFDDQGELDALRLLRAARAIAGEGEYLDYANTAQMRGLPAESKSVLDEGQSAGVVNSGAGTARDLRQILTPQRIAQDKASLVGLEKEARAAKVGRLARATADGYLSHGDWAKAAELYRLALEKGGEDPAVVNTRLGIALARSGDMAGARAAFGAVSGGTRATLAQYWLLWVDSQRPA